MNNIERLQLLINRLKTDEEFRANEIKRLTEFEKLLDDKIKED